VVASSRDEWLYEIVIQRWARGPYAQAFDEPERLAWTRSAAETRMPGGRCCRRVHRSGEGLWPGVEALLRCVPGAMYHTASLLHLTCGQWR